MGGRATTAWRDGLLLSKEFSEGFRLMLGQCLGETSMIPKCKIGHLIRKDDETFAVLQIVYPYSSVYITTLPMIKSSP